MRFLSPRQFLLFTVVSMLSVGALFAQKEDDSKVDPTKSNTSNLRKYRSSKKESSDARLKRAEAGKDKDPNAALDDVQEALAESIANENTLNEARSYTLLGEINERIQEWTLAVQNFEKAFVILSSDYPGSDEAKRALRGLSNANLEVGNYDRAVANYKELLTYKLDEGESNTARLGLSETYFRMGNYDEALRIAETLPVSKNSGGSAVRDNQIAKIYAKKNDVDKARGFLDLSSADQASAAPVAGNSLNTIQQAKEEVAQSLRSQKLYDDELKLRAQSIELNALARDFKEVTKDKIEIGKTLDAKGERSAAIRELVEASSLADTIDDPSSRAAAYLSLAELYQKYGQTENALSAYHRYSDAVRQSTERERALAEQRAQIIKKQEDIEKFSSQLYLERSEDKSQQAIIATQRIVIATLVVLVLIVGVTSIITWRSAQSSKRANQLLALKSLRSQMNPHFIFNALNSVNHFIAQQDERTANRFLSDFSLLMRLVLENSQEDFITLQKEQEILALYMKLEHYRFRDKFDYEISVDANINPETFLLPPMLIQPYLENAVWHGLRYRESKGVLTLTMRLEGDQILVRVTDNGIGRQRSAELKTENQKKHRSTGLKNIKERLTILNQVYHTHYDVNVSDGAGGEGTVVEIRIPAKHPKV